MPRVTEEHRTARRTAIVDAARRSFSRNGFHETSMADIAAEAGVSVGTPYRYFASKEELIVEIAGDAFRLVFEPLVQAARRGVVVSAADLVDLAVRPLRDHAAHEADTEDELLRCGVLAWAELLRHQDLGEQARRGFDEVRDAVAEVLQAGRAAGVVPAAVHPASAARVIIALLHGLVLQQAAFGLVDVTGFTDDARALLAPVETSNARRRPLSRQALQEE